MPLCPPIIQHVLAWDQIQASVVTGRWLTSRGTAPKCRWTFQYPLVYTWTTVTLELKCKIVLQTCHTPPNRLGGDKWSSEYAEWGGISASHPEFFSSSQNFRKFKTCSTYMIHNHSPFTTVRKQDMPIPTTSKSDADNWNPTEVVAMDNVQRSH